MSFLEFHRRVTKGFGGILVAFQLESTITTSPPPTDLALTYSTDFISLFLSKSTRFYFSDSLKITLKYRSDCFLPETRTTNIYTSTQLVRYNRPFIYLIYRSTTGVYSFVLVFIFLFIPALNPHAQISGEPFGLSSLCAWLIWQQHLIRSMAFHGLNTEQGTFSSGCLWLRGTHVCIYLPQKGRSFFSSAAGCIAK
jgi:hypothetical protein